jgi:hypothetical protein
MFLEAPRGGKISNQNHCVDMCINQKKRINLILKVAQYISGLIACHSILRVPIAFRPSVV